MNVILLYKFLTLKGEREKGKVCDFGCVCMCMCVFVKNKREREERKKDSVHDICLVVSTENLL